MSAAMADVKKHEPIENFGNSGAFLE